MKGFLVLLLAAVASAAPAGDLITSLTGLNYAINFNQYSGYLTGTTGNNLHYWFVESQNDPANDPVVLWLNGGPGCSSLDGLLTENGPFFNLADGSALYENTYSWNTVANVIYLEAPACVGFSYNDNNDCSTNDDETAQSNYLALQDFFSKFPEYTTNEFYITGESYAGVYIPTLSVLINDGIETPEINFQGYAIGNGLLSYMLNENSLMFFGFYHALLGQDLWDDLVSRCCAGVESQANCDFYSSAISLGCEEKVVVATDIMYYQGLNMYGLYKDCETSGPPSTIAKSKGRAFYDMLNVIRSQRSRPVPYDDPPCTNSYGTATWLNSAAVKADLHISSSANDWELCSALNYGRKYDNVASQISSLQGSVRALLYNGDTDMACNVLGNEWFITSLGFAETDSRKKWNYNGDVGGYVVRYEGLDFVTVRGAGHMVPTDRPGEALQMITAFLQNQPY